MDVTKKVIKVVSQVMGVPEKDVDENSSPDTIEKWDSLHHMNLIMALEQEFALQFDDQQIVEMLNVKLIMLETESMLNTLDKNT